LTGPSMIQKTAASKRARLGSLGASGKVWHPTAKHRPIRVLDGVKLAQDPRLGKLPTLVRPRDVVEWPVAP
jgi:hypothetical protein